MKILLISPKVSFTTNIEQLSNFWNFSNETSPYREYWSGVGTALLTIAALTPKNHDVYFIDENIRSIDFSKDYDVVGITAMTQQATRAYEIAKIFRTKGTKVILGGIHSTLLPDEAKKYADSIVIGEAEYVWGHVIKDIERSILKKIYKSKKIVDLKDSPIPRFDLIDISDYKIFSLQTTRGCPHDCEYCTASKIFGSKYRIKSVQQVINELILIKNIFGNKRIFFSDDNFLTNTRYSKELLESLSPLKLRWNGQSDISIGEDKHLLELLRKSGCTFLFIGLESISKEGLQNIDIRGWKARQLKNYTKNINNIQQQGIGVMGAFMVGLDSDTKKVFDNILNFVLDNNLYAASITIQTPFPGTRLRNRLEKEKRLYNYGWDKYTGYNLTFEPKNISPKELEDGITTLYEKVYSSEVYQNKMQYFKNIQKRLL